MRPQLSSVASGIVFRGGFGMPARNAPQKTLESWKQIAAYLDRSERTVRRWETSEGLPVTAVSTISRTPSSLTGMK